MKPYVSQSQQIQTPSTSVIFTEQNNNNNNNNNNKCDTSNNRNNWNHFKIIQKIPEQSTGNPLSQGATEKSHIGHCTHTVESTNVKVQQIQHWSQRFMYHEQEQQNGCNTVFPRDIDFLRSISVNILHKGDDDDNNNNNNNNNNNT